MEEELSTVVIDGEVLGNTQYVAYTIAENTGADIFRIEPVTPYPLDHSELEGNPEPHCAIWKVRQSLHPHPAPFL